MTPLIHTAKMRFAHLVCLVLFPVVQVAAQTSWTASGTGDFTVRSNWSSGVPSSSIDAFITNGTLATPTIANLNGATGNVANFQLGSFDTLNVNFGSNFVVNGNLVTNGGAINVNAGSGNNTFLQFTGNTTLQGGGTVTLNSGDNNGQVYLQQSASGMTLTNVDNTIEGYGVIGAGPSSNGLTVVNSAAGTIDANVSGQTLMLNSSGGITNAGLLEATSGGTLQITNVVSNAGSNITANGGNVLINSNGTIQGGTLNSVNGGALGVLNASIANLDGSANAIILSAGTTWTGAMGSVTNAQGTIVNNGNFQLNGGSGNNTFLQLTGSTTLGGGGTVTLNSGDNNGQVYLQQSASGMTLTNSDNMIQGYGVVGNGGLTVVNSAAGTIAANVSGRTLVLNGSGGITNLGLLEATNGGILQISAVVNNLNGNVTANAGTVNVNSTIQGGVLNSLNDGTLQTVGTATLDGSSQGPVTLSAGSTYYGSPASATNVQGTIVNFGNIQPNAGSGNNTFLQFTGNTTLQGGGTVTLNSGDNNGQVYLQQSASSVTLTNV